MIQKNDLLDFGTMALRCLPPETAHDLGCKLLKEMPKWRFFLPQSKSVLEDFKSLKWNTPLGWSNPIGLAAGFDKSAGLARELSLLSFSCIEVGTITPLPQPGNPKPRMFRLKDQQALVNRMGFNSIGLEAASQNLRLYSNRNFTLGVNVGKNKLTEEKDAHLDFVKGLEATQSFSDYSVINVSSPNTPGLRSLATGSFLSKILEATPKTNPSNVFVKLDPDRSVEDTRTLLREISALKFAGVIMTNTTTVTQPYQGGMSGKPLLGQTLKRIELSRTELGDDAKIIGVGGISDGYDVWNALNEGADGIQLYSAFIYRGPGVVLKMLREFVRCCEIRGVPKQA